MKKLILLLMIFFTSKIDIYALENPFNETEKFNVTSSDTSIKTNFSDLDYNFENYIDTEVKILDIIDPKSTGYNFIRFIPVNAEIDNITAPKNIFVQIGAKKFLNCDIRWNSIDTIDTSILGRSTLKGEIVPPSGYKFNGGLAPFIEIPFFIYKDEMAPLLTAEYNIDEISDNVELIPFGESISNYLNINDNYLFHTEYGDYFYCSVDWEIPDSTNTIGEITIKGKYRLPVGIKAKNEKSVYRYKTFYAMKDDDIYLNYIYKDSNFIIVQWIKSIKDFNNIKVFFKENNDQWSEAFENIYNVFDDRFVIYISRLNLNSNYEFKLNYNKKDYGNIHITTDKNHIKSYFINGDKDGGDNKEQKLPVYNSSSKSGSRQKSKKIKYFNENAVNSSISQNVTEFEMEYTTETIKNMTNTDPLPIEEITPNKTVISGDKLIETEKIQGDYITFEKNGVALEVPSNFIKNYDIKENDSIAVGINKDKENISVEVEINNKSIKSIKGSKLRISNKTEEISKNNILIKNTSKDNRFSEFFIDDLGTYKTVFKEKKEINYFVFISLGILILVAGAWFIKWLNTKK